jgi:3-oxosteroid 1-dehydrogenase
MDNWDHLTDLLVIGSGGGLVGAITATSRGRQALVIEKTEFIGGSTGMSGGVLWLPNNPLMQREGVQDSLEEALAYFEAVVGDVGPASSPARRQTYVEQGIAMVHALEEAGVRFVRCEGYSDYYADCAGIPGGKARGRAIEGVAWDGNQLGPWSDKIRPPFAGGLAMMTGDVAALTTLRVSNAGRARLLRVLGRSIAGRARRQTLLTNGASLIGQLLHVLLRNEVPVWTQTALRDLVVEDGAVVGAVVQRGDRTLRIRARDGVLLATGGYARSRRLREQWGGDQPNSAEWTSANPGDTGEALEVAMAHGAATDMLDEAWWIPSSMEPDGTPSMCISERSKPHSIIVDASGARYFNEAVAYQEAGQQMYARQRDHGGAVPSWLVMDARHRARYLYGRAMPGRTPQEWLTSGYFKRADTLDELAAQCGVDAARLRATVERFNGFARSGVDEDFARGQGAHDRYQGDPTHRPNPCLGEIAEAPFYAVALYPGDVGTSGGLLTDEFARVLDGDGAPMPGFYATGNCTASVMGRRYLGAGASIGASAVFARVAATHAATRTSEAARPLAAGMA